MGSKDKLKDFFKRKIRIGNPRPDPILLPAQSVTANSPNANHAIVPGQQRGSGVDVQQGNNSVKQSPPVPTTEHPNVATASHQSTPKTSPYEDHKESEDIISNESATPAAKNETEKRESKSFGDFVTKGLRERNEAHLKRKSDKDIAQFLKTKGYDIKAHNFNFEKALNWCATTKNIKAGEFLLEQRSQKPTNESQFLGAPLLSAVRHNRLDVVKLLLDWGANIQFSYQDRQTALHLAATKGSLKILEFLIEKGADLTVPDAAGRQPLYCAVANGKTNTAEALLLTKAVHNPPVDIEGVTCLQRAVDAKYCSVIRVLNEQGVDVKSDLDSPRLVNSFCIAAWCGHRELVEVLLDIGVLNGRKDERGPTALHLAKKTKWLTIIHLLEERGAEYTVEDEHEDPVQRAQIAHLLGQHMTGTWRGDKGEIFHF